MVIKTKFKMENQKNTRDDRVKCKKNARAEEESLDVQGRTP